MKILVTGIAGFIGSHLAERLYSMGHTVIGVDNFSNYYDVRLKRENAALLQSLGMEIIECDLRQEQLVRALPTDLDYIFHCAAQPGIASSSTFDDYLSNNIMATHHLATFAKRCHHLKLFVNIGTSSIYGVDVFCNEEQMAKPISNYGVTKLAAEQIVMSQARLGNFPACSLRLYSVYGSRERPDKMFTQLIDCALNKKAFPLFEGSRTHKRSFTHITDIVDGMVSVIGKEKACNEQVINLGTDKEYTTEQGIQTVEKLLDTAIKINMKPAGSGDQLRTKAVINKAYKILNYQPKVPLEDGVLEQIQWFQNRTGHSKQVLNQEP